MPVRALLALTALLAAPGCRAGARGVLLDVADPEGDVRLRHPATPGVEPGTFDLIRLVVTRRPDAVIVAATFARPVRRLAAMHLFEDARVRPFPQTVDVYLDLEPGVGELAALPGRGFHVPAAQGWDRVLVLSSVGRIQHPRAVLPTALTARGRTLVARFPASAVPGPIRGAVAVVLATSPRGEGGVRSVAALVTDCDGWRDDRCRLVGTPPPVLDATVARVGPVVALTYPGAAPPAPPRTPIVFQRGAFITVAPLRAAVTAGQLATVFDAAGQAAGTAVVQSVVGDTASLQVLGAPPGTLASVTFQGER